MRGRLDSTLWNGIRRGESLLRFVMYRAASSVTQGLGRRWGAQGIAIAVAVGSVVLGAMPHRAAAYRTLVDEPERGLTSIRPLPSPVSWRLSATQATPSQLEAIEAAAIASFDTWAEPSCTSLRGNYRGIVSTIAITGDGANTIELVYEGWVARGLPSGRGATTELVIERDSEGAGRVIEADVYVNFDQHAWSLGGSGAGLDLVAVLTHELLHVAGGVHCCEHDDATAPSCADASAECVASASYPDYSTGQRSPSADDRALVCALYPAIGCTPSCAVDEVCVEGTCVAECKVRDCTPDCDAGECGAPRCTVDADCGGRVCGVAGSAALMCVPAGALGAPCASGGECASRLCVTSTQLPRPFCSDACARDADCSGGLVCRGVGGRDVCAPPPPAAGCRASSAIARPTVLGMFVVACAAARRRRRRNMDLLSTPSILARLSLWASAIGAVLVAVAACGCDAASPSETDAGRAMDARVADTGTGDAGDRADTGAADARMVDAPVADSGPPDGDGDGVPTATDCDDADPEIGASASRACTSPCGDGTETCTDGAWGACSAPTDCVCSSEGMMRVATCGNCGMRGERCTAGLWTPTGPCLGEGECAAGTTEMRTDVFCGVQARLCGATCAWGPWIYTREPGECRPGTRTCIGSIDCVCRDDCTCADNPDCP